MTAPAELPTRIRSRADVDRLLALATNYEQRVPDALHAFDLQRMTRLLARHGDPQRGPLTLQVAGSKGKGSTARMLDAGLQAARVGPVGLYTSPHVTDLGERIAIDGRPVDDDALAGALDRLLPDVHASYGTAAAPTFFELLTAAAWLIFRDRGCRTVVLETGLGGRLDATTVCAPAVTLITTIELEHTQLLGDTLEQIAAEKAGILKPGVPAITGTRAPALGVIEARAAALRAPLSVLGRDLTLEEVQILPGPRTRARLRTSEGTHTLELALAGAHQAHNAALAFAALRQVGVAAPVALAALARVRLPAALEPFPGRPTVVLDGAHTVESARAARASVAACWPGRPLSVLVALMADKRVEDVLAVLLPGAVGVTATAVASPRALEAAALAQACRRASPAPVAAVDDPLTALAAARAAAPPEGVLLVAGSLYLAGLLRPHLLRDATPAEPA